MQPVKFKAPLVTKKVNLKALAVLSLLLFYLPFLGRFFWRFDEVAILEVGP